MRATVAPPSVRPNMIWIRGTGATSVSLREPNCRSHSRPMPENTAVNSHAHADDARRNKLQVAAPPGLAEDRVEPEAEHSRYRSGWPSEAST